MGDRLAVADVLFLQCGERALGDLAAVHDEHDRRHEVAQEEEEAKDHGGRDGGRVRDPAGRV